MTPQRFAKLRAVLNQRQPDLTVFADGVHKPHNISAILRTCDAVGLSHLHAVSIDGDIRQHHMLAGGSKRWVDVVVHESSAGGLAQLRADGWRLAIADTRDEAVDYRDVDYTEKLAIVMGAELDGPSDDSRSLADVAIAVPMHGLVESLNVSVATAVILFEAERQRRAAGMYDVCRIPDEVYQKKLFEWAHPNIAQRCQDRGLAYPAMNDVGDLIENPFA